MQKHDPMSAAARLLAHCEANDWAGYDPYDALNSGVFAALPMLDFRAARIALTQVLKRSPVNVRPLVLIPKTQNPKGLALFLTAALKLSRLGLLGQAHLIDTFIERLVALRSPGSNYWCWGYSFPWQTRTIVVPRGAPNLVCTTFVADALLDAYEQRGDSRCLEMARSAADYILEQLYWTEGDSVASLSYPTPGLPVRIHNANFLGAALLCRVHRHTQDAKLLETALKVARYSASRQQPDGSWLYGELPTQAWIDNFHTGYNLCGLYEINRNANTQEFEAHIRRGYDFYRAHFIRRDGAARYFHNSTYPIDIHCVAQTIITLVVLRELDPDSTRLAQSVLQWAVRHLWDEGGFFYYRALRFATIRTSYMRWSQAWMLLAIATLLTECAPVSEPSEPRESPALA